MGRAHLDRRNALILLGGSALAGVSAGAALGDETAEILGAAQDAAGVYRVGAIGPSLAESAGPAAALRLHAVCPRPDGREAVAMARRPGDLALVLDGEGRRLRSTFRASKGRRFAGHGVFVNGQNDFLSTEIDVATGEGRLVLRDVAGGYAPVAEYPSAGFGPHELVPAGRLVAVANGSRERRSDPGIAALERVGAASNLALLDPRGGAVDRIVEAGAGLESLSLRHLASLPGGGVLVAAQDREQGVRDRPLVARFDGGRLRFLDEDLEATPRLAGYVGSIAVDRSGRFAAASSPKGGAVVLFDLEAGRAIGAVGVADVCGLAADHASDRFIATTGLGDMLRIAVTGDGCAIVRRRVGALRWDNHLAARPPLKFS